MAQPKKDVPKTLNVEVEEIELMDDIGEAQQNRSPVGKILDSMNDVVDGNKSAQVIRETVANVFPQGRDEALTFYNKLKRLRQTAEVADQAGSEQYAKVVSTNV